MSVQTGANLGLLVAANDGDSYGDAFRKFLRAIDALVFPFVLSLTTMAPPANPAEGDRYVVPIGATGAWAGKTNALASWTLKDPANPAGVWEFFTPKGGFEITAPGSGGAGTMPKSYVFDGATWELQTNGSGASVELMHDGVDNVSQTKLNLKSGANVTIADDGNGGITIAASGGPGSSIDLQHDGVENGSQSKLNLKAGANVTIADDGAGGITITATQPTLPTFKTNGTTNGSQSLLNLKNGSNITLSEDGAGGVTIASTAPASSIDLQHDGTKSGSQSKLNLKSGTNVTISDDGAGGITISATGSGASIDLQHDGTPNGSQSKLNLRSGTNIAITDDGFGGIIIASNDPHLPTLKTNGVANGSQDVLNLFAGPNVALLDDGAGNVSIGASAPIFQVNSTNKTNQGKVDFRSGNGIAITDVGSSGGLKFDGVTLKTNGTTNGSQAILNLKAGSNITLTDDGAGGVTVAAQAGATNIVYSLSKDISAAAQQGVNVWACPAAGGLYRVTASIRVKTAGSSGFATINPQKGSISSPSPNCTCTPVGNFASSTYTTRWVNGDQLSWYCIWTSISGSPVFTIDIVVEYLGA